MIYVLGTIREDGSLKDTIFSSTNCTAFLVLYPMAINLFVLSEQMVKAELDFLVAGRNSRRR